MKKILALLLFLAIPAGAQVITATVGVTNATVNGNSIIVNGVTRYATNAASPFTTTFPVGATTSLSASNLFIAYASSVAPNMRVSLIGTNVTFATTLPGAANVITFGGTWAVVSYSTNYFTNAVTVRAPYGVEGSVQTTNIASALVKYVGDNSSTNTIPAAAPALVNFMSLSGVQIASGAKNFTGGLSGTGGVGTNRAEVGLVTTNGQNFGNPFRSPGTGSASEQFGLNSQAIGVAAIAFGDNADAVADGSIGIGYNTLAQGFGSIALGYGATVDIGAVGAIAIGQGTTEAYAQNAIAIGAGASAGYTNSVAIGQNSFTTTTNQIALGRFDSEVHIPGSVDIVNNLQVAGVITQAHLSGTNTIAGDISYARKDISTLANGANTVASSTNTFLKVSGPSGGFSIAGLDGGRDGRLLFIENATGQTMTIANDSGLTASTNRVYTGTGSDIVNSSNPGMVQLLYDLASTHWVVVTSH